MKRHDDDMPADEACMKDFWDCSVTAATNTGSTGDCSVESLLATADAMESLRRPRTFAVLSSTAMKQFQKAGPEDRISELFGIPIFIEDESLERFAIVRKLREEHPACVVFYEDALGQVVELR